MAKNYKEVPWWWYMIVLVFSFILGLVVVIKENITMPVWAYVVSLIVGIIVAPFVSTFCGLLSLTSVELTVFTQSALIYSRFGNGIATNNLSKMIAGLVLPGRPVGNMYFAAWSHNVITNTVNLCNDLKMGEYRKYHSLEPLQPCSDTMRSQDPSSRHVHYPNLWYHLGRLPQLRYHDLHRQW